MPRLEDPFLGGGATNGMSLAKSEVGDVLIIIICLFLNVNSNKKRRRLSRNSLANVIQKVSAKPSQTRKNEMRWHCWARKQP